MVDAAESGSERVGSGADLACLLFIFHSSETCSVPDLHHDTGKIQDLSCPSVWHGDNCTQLTQSLEIKIKTKFHSQASLFCWYAVYPLIEWGSELGKPGST